MVPPVLLAALLDSFLATLLDSLLDALPEMFLQRCSGRPPDAEPMKRKSNSFQKKSI